MQTQTLQIIKYQELLCIIAKLFFTRYGSIPTAFDWWSHRKGPNNISWALLGPTNFVLHIFAQHLNTNKRQKPYWICDHLILGKCWIKQFNKHMIYLLLEFFLQHIFPLQFVFSNKTFFIKSMLIRTRKKLWHLFFIHQRSKVLSFFRDWLRKAHLPKTLRTDEVRAEPRNCMPDDPPGKYDIQ